MKNDYTPHAALIADVRNESGDVKTFTVKLEDRNLQESFRYDQGQFAEVSLPGYGEAPISFSSRPSPGEPFQLTIRAMGKLTRRIHQLTAGDRLYIRGPYGRPFPFEELAGRKLLFVAGGIGLAPLRSVIQKALSRRTDFSSILILYGARNPRELLFRNDLEAWAREPDTEVRLTVDEADETWRGRVGVVTMLWDSATLAMDKLTAFVCGPPIMIRFATEKLVESGLAESDILVTLERYMKCGIGKCGHCNIGEKFVCVDGPVFSCAELRTLPLEG